LALPPSGGLAELLHDWPISPPHHPCSWRLSLSIMPAGSRANDDATLAFTASNYALRILDFRRPFAMILGVCL